MSSWPRLIQIRFTYKQTGESISNLLVGLCIETSHKNDYQIGPKLSDKKGSVAFSREEVEQTAEEAQSLFIMDYSGLHSATGMISIVLESKKSWRNRIQNAENFFPENTKRLERLVSVCSNDIEVNEECTFDLSTAVDGDVLDFDGILAEVKIVRNQ